MPKKRAIKVYVSEQMYDGIRIISEELDISMSKLFVSALVNFAESAIEELSYDRKNLHHTSSSDS